MKQILIDLDGTLLENDMDVFAPAYYKLLSGALAAHIQPDILIRYLLAGTKAMIQNQDPARTLEQAFDGVFYPGIGIPKAAIIKDIHAFYQNTFPQLISVTRRIPAAIEFVDEAMSKGYPVSIATNPLFPRIAIDERLKWAGLDPVKYQFKVISSYEAFHFAKPNPGYYREFAEKLNVPPSECVMIGNDFEADIIPSRAAGMLNFHITAPDGTPASLDCQPTGHISEALAWVESM